MLFGNLFKKKDFKIDKEQINAITTFILEQYDVYKKGMLKELIDSNIKIRLKLADLQKKVKKLEETKVEQSEVAKVSGFKCSICKNFICKEQNTGTLEVTFKCIKSGARFTKNFENWNECHKWHKTHWNEVVING